MANLSKFFSAALEAAKKIEQNKGTMEQMRAALLKHGAKPAELQYTGYDDFAKRWSTRKERLGPSVDDKLTRDQVVNYLDRHQVQPGEVQYVGASGGSDADAEEIGHLAEQMILAHSANPDEARRARQEFRRLVGYDFHPDMYQLTRMTPEEIAQNWQSLDGSSADQDAELDAAISRVWDSELADRIGISREGDTKWGDYLSAPASDRYTEHLVTLPKYSEDNYDSPHWSEPNVLAHMRYDFDPDALRLEELQSDWLQTARERGFRWTPEEREAHTRKQIEVRKDYEDFRDKIKKNYEGYRLPMSPESGLGTGDYATLGIEDAQRFVDLHNRWMDLKNKTAWQQMALPRAPLSNVNDWTSMLARRALLEAALNDKPIVRITPGVLQDARYSGASEGRAKYYDQIVPNVFKKIIKPYGEAKIVPAYEYGDDPTRIAAVTTDRQPEEYHTVHIPLEMMEALQKAGKVPFFSHGGEVEHY